MERPGQKSDWVGQGKNKNKEMQTQRVDNFHEIWLWERGERMGVL